MTEDCYFSSFKQNAMLKPQIMSETLPSTPYLINCLLIITFDTTVPLIISLNNLYINIMTYCIMHLVIGM